MANTVKDFAAPDGPILLLSAKGLTTAGIAAANGVKDFSGNGNHGTASGGIGVTNDSEMGSCFDFTDLSAVQSINGAFQNPSNSVTVSIRYKRTGSIAQRNQLLIGDANSSNVCRLSIYITTRTDPNLVQVAIYTNNEVILSCNINTEYGMVTSDPHLYTSTYDASTSSLCLYVDDKLVASTTVVVQTFTVSKFMLGYPTASYRPVGLISEARIYPRALSAAEVKYLYNGFQPNIIIGQTIPSGAILDLSARGLTTAGIAQANGVVDRSGNMNAGTAYGGTSIVNDSSLGECFSFDGSDDYMEFNKSSFMNAFSNIQGLTVAFKMKPNNVSGKDIVLFEGFYDEAITLFAIRLYQGKINYYVRRKTSDSWVTYSSSLSITQNGVYRVAVLFDWQSEKVSLYIDGTLDSTYNTSFGAGNLLNSPTFIWLGKHSKVNRCYRGLLTDVLVYPRALTASEVQQLADASLKNITNIKYGSSDVRHIYYGSNPVYMATANYRPPLSGYAALTNPKDNSLVKLTASTFTNTSQWEGTLILPDGNILLPYGRNDRRNSCIKILSGSTGAEIYSYGSHGNNEGQFRAPAGVAYNPDTGDIYIGEYNGGSTPTYITKFNYDGERLIYIKRISIPNTVFGMYYSKARNAVLVAGWQTGRAYQVDSNLTAYQELTNTNFPSYAGEQCITCTSDGLRVYIGQYAGQLCEATFASASAVAASSHRTLISNSSGPDVCSVQMLSDNVTLLVATRTDSLSSKEVFLFNTNTKTKTVISSSSWPPLHNLQYNGNNVFTGVSQNSSANQVDVYRLNLNF